ncbi:hypothetical protein HK096_000553, partial [Nowakowskiella sp. JEL0078]
MKRFPTSNFYLHSRLNLFRPTASYARFLSSNLPSVHANLKFVGEHDIPFLYVLLPSADSPVSFRISKLKPISHILAAIQEEDKTITKIALFDSSLSNTDSSTEKSDVGAIGVRWARSTSAEDVLAVALKHGSLVLEINDEKIPVKIQTLEERLKPIQEKLALLHVEIEPLEIKKKTLDQLAKNSASRMTWLGLVA